MQYSIHDVVRLTGLTSRTLRHYDQLGLLRAGRSGNGYRSYTPADLVRLQEVLLLRELGVRLPVIAEMLDGGADPAARIDALTDHLARLRADRDRLDRRLASVERTLTALTNGDDPMPETMFDGFEPAAHADEVERRWGADARRSGDAWWAGLGASDREAHQAEMRAIAASFASFAAAGAAPDDEGPQELAARHYAWLVRGWQGRRPTPEQLRGIAALYVDDPRFGEHYAPAHAFVRDALVAFAATL